MVHHTPKLDANTLRLKRVRAEISKGHATTMVKCLANPPPDVVTIMRATLMLLGHPEKEVTDWVRITALAGKTGPGSLKRRCVAQEPHTIPFETVQRVKSSLHGLSTASATKAAQCAGTFCLWYDDAIQTIGSFGRYQQIVFFLGNVYTTGGCLVNLCFVFISALPDHWCHIPSLDGMNLTLEEQRNLSIPRSTLDGKETYSHCKMYDLPYSNMTGAEVTSFMTGNRSEPKVDCRHGWEYDTSQYKTSIAMDWDLVCANRPLSATTQSVFMAGFMVGVISCGFLADIVGRKWSQRIVAVLSVVTSILSAFSVNFYMFLALRFFIAFSIIPAFTIYFVLVMELVGPEWRLFVGMVQSYFWSLGYFVIVACAYYLREWRHLQLTLSLLLITYLPVLYIFPESPRWLYTKGRREEADDLMREIAKKNGEIFPEKWSVVVTETEPVYIWSILRYPKLRCRSFIMFYLWCVCSLVYYGLSLNTSAVGGNDYVNFLISGAIEIPAYIVVHLTMDRWGRRCLVSGSLMLSGVALLLITAVPVDTGYTWAMITLTSVGKFGVSAAFSIVYIFAAELFPTVVRSSGIGASSFCARIGGIVAPQMALLGDFSRFIPFVTFGVLSLLAGLLGLLLPETTNRKLPETLLDAEEFGMKETDDSKTKLKPKDDTNDKGEDNPTYHVTDM